MRDPWRRCVAPLALDRTGSGTYSSLKKSGRKHDAASYGTAAGANAMTLLFDGIAYGMLLFILASGLSVTLGLMHFVNLAHGAFAMFGGYVTVVLMQRYGVPFVATLPLAFLAAALLGLVLERLLYARVYGRSQLDQVLFSIGLVFIAIAAADYIMGSETKVMTLPAWLEGRIDILGGSIGRYRAFVIAICIVIVIVLQSIVQGTRFGSQLRAAVDDARVARGLGIRVPLIFTATFAVGSGLAGLGGALGSEILGLDPAFPLKYMIYFLIVVTVGGTTSLTGPFLAAIILGIADVMGKYHLPLVGSFIIYTLMIIALILRPQGLFAKSR